MHSVRNIFSFSFFAIYYTGFSRKACQKDIFRDRQHRYQIKFLIDNTDSAFSVNPKTPRIAIFFPLIVISPKSAGYKPPSIFISVDYHKVFINTQEVDFPRREFDLFYLLASNPGRVYTQEQLYELIWNGDYYYVLGYSDKHQAIEASVWTVSAPVLTFFRRKPYRSRRTSVSMIFLRPPSGCTVAIVRRWN